MAHGRKISAGKRPVSLAVVGDVGHVDFSSARRWLEQHQPQYFADCAAASAHFATQPAPAWLLLFSAGRGSLSQKWVERLHRRAPFSKILNICGSWCEGETRSGRALSGVPRVYWHQFESRATAALQSGADYAGWSLPRTATPLDLLQQPASHAHAKSMTTLGIIADRRGDFLALSDCSIACGFGAKRCAADQLPAEVSALLWDCQSLGASRLHQLHRLLQLACGRPLFVLLDFPRQSETEAVLAAGGAAVLSKPLLLGDLRGAVLRHAELSVPKASRQAG